MCDVHSSYQDILKGVPQGEVLGPELFNVLIKLNDTSEFVSEAALYHYADDNAV